MDTIVFPEVHLPVRDYGVVVALVNLLSQDQGAQPASITQGCLNETKITFYQKSLSVHIFRFCFVRLSKRVSKSENVAMQRCHICFKGDRNASKMPLTFVQARKYVDICEVSTYFLSRLFEKYDKSLFFQLLRC